METNKPPPVFRRQFSKEFRAAAVALVLDGDRPVAAVARDLGIGEGTPVNWVRQSRIDRGGRCGLTRSELTELVWDALHTVAAARGHHTAGVVFLRPRQSVPVGRLRRRVETPPDAPIGGTRRQLLGQQRRRVVLRDAETRTHHPDTVHHPNPSTT